MLLPLATKLAYLRSQLATSRRRLIVVGQLTALSVGGDISDARSGTHLSVMPRRLISTIVGDIESAIPSQLISSRWLMVSQTHTSPTQRSCNWSGGDPRPGTQLTIIPRQLLSRRRLIVSQLQTHTSPTQRGYICSGRDPRSDSQLTVTYRQLTVGDL